MGKARVVTTSQRQWPLPSPTCRHRKSWPIRSVHVSPFFSRNFHLWLTSLLKEGPELGIAWLLPLTPHPLFSVAEHSSSSQQCPLVSDLLFPPVWNLLLAFVLLFFSIHELAQHLSEQYSFPPPSFITQLTLSYSFHLRFLIFIFCPVFKKQTFFQPPSSPRLLLSLPLLSSQRSPGGRSSKGVHSLLPSPMTDHFLFRLKRKMNGVCVCSVCLSQLEHIACVVWECLLHGSARCVCAVCVCLCVSVCMSVP